MTEPLSSRELEVLTLRAHGLSTGEAATALGVAYQTAKNHCNNAFLRLGVNCVEEAYIALGWLTPPPHDALRRVSDRP